MLTCNSVWHNLNVKFEIWNSISGFHVTHGEEMANVEPDDEQGTKTYAKKYHLMEP